MGLGPCSLFSFCSWLSPSMTLLLVKVSSGTVSLSMSLQVSPFQICICIATNIDSNAMSVIIETEN